MILYRPWPYPAPIAPLSLTSKHRRGAGTVFFIGLNQERSDWGKNNNGENRPASNLFFLPFLYTQITTLFRVSTSSLMVF